MKEQLIFGYSWEEIQAAQQGSKLSEHVQQNSTKPLATKADEELLLKYGNIDALKKAGLHGVVDKLINSGFAA